MSYCVYILYSVKAGVFYKGQTNDVASKPGRHNQGKERYTSRGRPRVLMWYSEKATRSESLIKEFSKQFKYSISLNLEKSYNKSYFTDKCEVKNIVESLFLANNTEISEIKETLIFIDEIQESPEAIQILRYSYEEYPELYVISEIYELDELMIEKD